MGKTTTYLVVRIKAKLTVKARVDALQSYLIAVTFLYTANPYERLLSEGTALMRSYCGNFSGPSWTHGSDFATLDSMKSTSHDIF
jgi:hypothetical protein